MCERTPSGQKRGHHSFPDTSFSRLAAFERAVGGMPQRVFGSSGDRYRLGKRSGPIQLPGCSICLGIGRPFWYQAVFNVMANS